jgi:hypothetical protein
MSTSPRVPDKTPPPAAAPGKFRSFLAYLFLPRGKPGEIVIISHSNLFYWWPVWLVGYIMAILTLVEKDYMVIVPDGTQPADVVGLPRRYESGEIAKKDNGEIQWQKETRAGYVLAPGKKLLTRKTRAGTDEDIKADTYMARSKNYGILYVVVLLLVIFITNVPLRGLWSVFIIIVILLLSIIFAQSGVWEAIVSQSQLLAIHINLGGYLFISTAVLIIWLVNFFFFDHQFYMIFTPGQVRVHLEIGAGETVYDTGGMVFQKQRSDLFRHWILGFGSGDLIVRPAGGTQHIDLPNVLHVGRRVREIEKKLAEKEVVAG